MQEKAKPSRSVPRRALRWILIVVAGGLFLLFGPLFLVVAFNLTRPIPEPEYLRTPASAQQPAAIAVNPAARVEKTVRDSATASTQTLTAGLFPADTLATPELKGKASAINQKYEELKKFYAAYMADRSKHPDGFGKIFRDYDALREELGTFADPQWQRRLNDDFLRMMHERQDWEMIIEFCRRQRVYDNWNAAMFACRKKGIVVGGLYIAALVTEPIINEAFSTIHKLKSGDD
ncbi:hypothetical protein LLG95_16355 [bacterium]|nr:hypothetical protein [bacterium]